MDDNVVVLESIAVIYDLKLVSLKQAVAAVNDGNAKIELENLGTTINMFIRENKNGSS